MLACELKNLNDKINLFITLRTKEEGEKETGKEI